jgi:LPXTG-site transpeptidase (sortase) family protein
VLAPAADAVAHVGGAPPRPPAPPGPDPARRDSSRRDDALAIVRPTAAAVLLALVAVWGFAAWLSGARFEAEQGRGFTAFERTTPLIADGTIADRPWPSGVPVALLRFPKFDRTLAVFSGGSRTDLRRGPAYDPASVFPGQAGNTVIIGKRSTYGSPFARLGGLSIGDQVILTTPAGNLAYRVSSTRVVDHEDGAIYTATDRSTLSLVTSAGWNHPTRVVLVTAALVAGSIDGSMKMPAIADVHQVSFSWLRFVGLAWIAGFGVFAARRLLPMRFTPRASWAMVVPFLLALGFPLVQQLLLILPRTL